MSQRADGDSETGLRDRLIEVALALLAKEGVEALTLRSVARRAGVSHGAPARHFRGLSDLRAEVAAVGYRMLSEAIDKSNAAQPAAAGRRRRLAAAGRAYIECALANPGLFALMFRSGDLDPLNEAYTRDSSAAYQSLLELVRVAQSAGWQTSRDSNLLAGAIWASVHGLATLWAQGAYQKANPEASLDDAITTTLQMTDHDRSGETR